MVQAACWGQGGRVRPAWVSRTVARVHHHVFHFIFMAEKATSVFYLFLDSISGSAWQEDIHGDNCAGGFGMEHQSVSRLNVLQMLFIRHHAGSKLQTKSSAQTSFHYETGAFSYFVYNTAKTFVFFIAPCSISLVLLYP